jgi:hypothetical protein
LFVFLKALWYDNVPLSIDQWHPAFESTDGFDELDAQAAEVMKDKPDWDGTYSGDDSPWEIFAYGGDEEENVGGTGLSYEQYKAKYEKLDDFLNSCFDGDLAFQWQPRDTP